MIRVLSKLDELMAIKQDWIDLARKAESPLLDFDWFVSCIETIDRKKKIFIITVNNNNRVTAIAPLCLASKSGTPVLELIGSSTLYEPSGLLYDSVADLKILMQAIVKQNYHVALFRIPADSEDYRQLVEHQIKGALAIRKITAASNYVQTDSSWDQFLAGLSANRRYDFKRKLKRLAKQGELRKQIFNPSPQDLDRYLDLAFEVEHRSWKGRNKSSLLANKELQAFFRNYLRKTCTNNELRLCLYFLDDRAIAMHIGVVAYNCFWVLKLGYDEALSKCSPGILQAMDTVEYAFKQNLTRYEFLGSEEKWQSSWPVQQHQYCTILLFPFSIRGLTALSVTFLKIVLSKIRRITGN